MKINYKPNWKFKCKESIQKILLMDYRSIFLVFPIEMLQKHRDLRKEIPLIWNGLIIQTKKNRKQENEDQRVYNRWNTSKLAVDTSDSE
jgi:hypothetical protein